MGKLVRARYFTWYVIANPITRADDCVSASMLPDRWLVGRRWSGCGDQPLPAEPGSVRPIPAEPSTAIKYGELSRPGGASEMRMNSHQSSPRL